MEAGRSRGSDGNRWWGKKASDKSWLGGPDATCEPSPLLLILLFFSSPLGRRHRRRRRILLAVKRPRAQSYFACFSGGPGVIEKAEFVLTLPLAQTNLPSLI